MNRGCAQGVREVAEGVVERKSRRDALRIDEGESGGGEGGRGRKRVYEVRVGRRYNIAYANSLWT